MFRKLITTLQGIWRAAITKVAKEKDSVNIASQNQNSVGGDMAAGNINKNKIDVTVNIITFLNDYRHDNYNLKDDQIQEINKILKCFDQSKSHDSHGFTPMTYNEFSKDISNAADYKIQQKQFGSAHKLYAEALDNPDSKNYNSFFKQYLITGFIYYSQENDMGGLRNLLSRISKSNNIKDAEIDIIAVNIFQEICSRDSNLDDLNNYMRNLEDLYNEASIFIKSSMANSLGLAYRRLGERSGIEFLNKALLIFDSGLRFNKENLNLEVDLKDQKAITYIRIFESNGDPTNLNEAERLLFECVNLFSSINDFRGNRLKPRVLNNLGNAYKQKALCIDDGEKVINANKALFQYAEAEKYWDKTNAKYEWALLQKNKAETKYALSKVTNDYCLLIEAIEECLNSTEYRNIENSPYQWHKSVEIIFKIIELLNSVNELKLIPKSFTEKIFACIKEMEENKAIWDEQKFAHFFITARRVSVILNTIRN